MLNQVLDTSMTIRMALSLRQYIDGEAMTLGMPTSEYARYKLSDKEAQSKMAVIFERRARQAEYAKILMALGKSRIANNLNQIAYAINTGTFVFTPDVIAQINEAYEAIMYMRRLLIQAEGIKV